MKRNGIVAAAAAWMALTATGAHAQAARTVLPCLTPVEAQSAFLMLSPAALRAIQTRCAPALPANAYLRTRGDWLVARYQGPADAARPAGSAALARVLDFPIQGLDISFIVAPLMAVELKKLDGGDCATIDQALALLEPLPPANVAGLALLALESGAGDGLQNPIFSICRPGGR